MDTQIDIVFTWLDPSNLKWIETRNHYRRKYNIKYDDKRQNNVNELKYSIRCVLKNCNFVNNIYIISNSSVPSWIREEYVEDLTKCVSMSQLDEKNAASNKLIRVISDVTLVGHNTYNSNAIELCIHKIKGLTNKFLYLNDDFFIMKPTKLSDFYKDRSHLHYDVTKNIIERVDKVVHTIMKSINVELHNAENDVKYQAISDTKCQHISSAKYTFDTIKNNGGIVNENIKDFIDLGHTPRLFDKEIMFNVSHIYEKEVNNTINNIFRTDHDITAFDLFVYGSNVFRTSNDLNTMFIEANTQMLLQLIMMQHPHFLCINNANCDGVLNEVYFESLFETLMKDKSRVEK